MKNIQFIVNEELGRPKPVYSDKALALRDFERKHLTVIFRHQIDQPPTLRRKIGKTEYTVSGRLSPTARETAAAKMQRLILNDFDSFNEEN